MPITLSIAAKAVLALSPWSMLQLARLLGVLKEPRHVQVKQLYNKEATLAGVSADKSAVILAIIDCGVPIEGQNLH